jgi:uncharacterized membrane protein YeaQ/YmgE (transglycosylase-associated protein family)
VEGGVYTRETPKSKASAGLAEWAGAAIALLPDVRGRACPDHNPPACGRICPREGHTMSTESIIVALIVGAIGGWLAGLIVRGAGFGIVGNIVIGILGALLSSWLLPQLGLSFSVGNALVTSILYAMVGAVIVLVLLSLIRRAA